MTPLGLAPSSLKVSKSNIGPRPTLRVKNSELILGRKIADTNRFYTSQESQEKKMNENLAKNKFRTFMMKVMAWNFSTRVIVCNNVLAELGVIVFIVFYIMSRMFYRQSLIGNPG